MRGDIPAFQIEIAQQGWLAEDDRGLPYDASRIDLCSHGAIRLRIGRELISAGEEAYEYGVSESALALLRTLEADHSAADPVAERLIFHGCGLILMMGCPVGIDWSVSHCHGEVFLSDVLKYDSTSEGDVLRYPDLAVQMSEGDYRRSIVAFAERAKELFVGITKEIDDDWDRKQYAEFWQEFDARLDRARSAQ
jgi:hypothetical protein